MTSGAAALTPWAGLGQRAPAPAPATRPAETRAPNDEDGDEFARPSIQRVVPATSAAPIALATASPFQHPYVPAGSADTPTQPAADTPTLETTPMPKQPAPKTSAARPTDGASARFQICSLLMAKGDMSREELLADVSADSRAFSNAIYNAKKVDHIVYIKKDDKYHITKEGREWTSGGVNLANHKAEGRTPPPKATKKAKAAAAPKAKAPNLVFVTGEANPLNLTKNDRRFMVVDEQSFRCALYSDGSFSLAKNGQCITLTTAEHAQMLAYLERIAE